MAIRALRWLLKPLLTGCFVVFLAGNVWAGGYLKSAHGNSDYGVDRISMHKHGYATGNCAHCHSMHASIGGSSASVTSSDAFAFALFAENFNKDATTHPYVQGDDFCFYCHISSNSLQKNGITNEDFSATFGGAPETVTSIFDQFNELSYHNLYDIYNFASNRFPSFFTSYSNPCIACHNPHLARRDRAHVTDPLYSAVSLPTEHNKLWKKTIKSPNSYYQAPFYYNSKGTYEPGGVSVSDGSKTVDWNTFCTRCHNNTNVIYSTTLGRDLKKIDWTTPITVNPTTGAETGGDKHGAANATGNVTATLLPPYSTYLLEHGYTSGITLSCLDCHEPHGSPNIMLIRRVINGNDTWYNSDSIINITDYTSDQWRAVCDRCHISNQKEIHHGIFGMRRGGDEAVADHYSPPYPRPRGCGRCHMHGSSTGGMRKGMSPIPCTYCHFHGGDDSWLLSVNKTYYTGRRCF